MHSQHIFWVSSTCTQSGLPSPPMGQCSVWEALSGALDCSRSHTFTTWQLVLYYCTSAWDSLTAAVSAIYLFLCKTIDSLSFHFNVSDPGVQRCSMSSVTPKLKVSLSAMMLSISGWGWDEGCSSCSLILEDWRWRWWGLFSRNCSVWVKVQAKPLLGFW